MKSHMVLLAVVVLAGVLEADAQETLGRRDFLAAIQELGGEVVVDTSDSETPVDVILTGSSRPADCMPLLKGVPNLRTCDL